MAKKTEVKKTAALTFKTLDELQALVDGKINCRFRLDGREANVPVSRISPAVAEKERQIKRAVQPPYKPDRKDYDPLDAKFLADRDLANLKARAFIVYSCCPLVSAKRPGLTSTDDIFAFVQGLLTENILNVIALTAQAGGLDLDVEAQKTANFTPAPGLED